MQLTLASVENKGIIEQAGTYHPLPLCRSIHPHQPPPYGIQFRYVLWPLYKVCLYSVSYSRFSVFLLGIANMQSFPASRTILINII